MKIIKCLNCKEKWYVDEVKIDNLKCCPFCENNLREEDNKVDMALDSFDKIIYSAIIHFGIDVFQNYTQFTAYLKDIIGDSKELKKEGRIFCRIVNVYYNDIVEIFLLPFNKCDSNMQKLNYNLMEEEGLSEAWAEKICTSITNAKYMLNQKKKYKITAEISEYATDQKIFKSKHDNKNINNDTNNIHKRIVGNRKEGIKYLDKLAIQIVNIIKNMNHSLILIEKPNNTKINREYFVKSLVDKQIEKSEIIYISEEEINFVYNSSLTANKIVIVEDTNGYYGYGSSLIYSAVKMNLNKKVKAFVIVVFPGFRSNYPYCDYSEKIFIPNGIRNAGGLIE